MGLFKKPAKFREYQVKCVHCGRTHTLRQYFAEKYYLDGMPQLSTEKLFAKYAVCDCGAFIYLTAEHNPVSKQVMQSPEYQQAITLEFPKNILALNDIVSPAEFSTHLERFHVEPNKENLQKCIHAMPASPSSMPSFDAEHLPQLHLRRGLFEYSTDLCHIDLLRQLQHWEECTQKIQQLRMKEFSPLLPKYVAFLDYEAELVRRKDSALQ